MKSKKEFIPPDLTKITNISGQGMEIYVSTPEGSDSHWLAPRSHILVPASYVTEQIRNLQKRRILRIG